MNKDDWQVPKPSCAARQRHRLRFARNYQKAKTGYETHRQRTLFETQEICDPPAYSQKTKVGPLVESVEASYETRW